LPSQIPGSTRFSPETLIKGLSSEAQFFIAACIIVLKPDLGIGYLYDQPVILHVIHSLIARDHDHQFVAGVVIIAAPVTYPP